MWRCVQCGGVYNVEVCAMWRCVQCGGVCNVEGRVTSVSFMRLWASLKRVRSVVGVRPSRFGSARQSSRFDGVSSPWSWLMRES